MLLGLRASKEGDRTFPRAAIEGGIRGGSGVAGTLTKCYHMAMDVVSRGIGQCGERGASGGTQAGDVGGSAELGESGGAGGSVGVPGGAVGGGVAVGALGGLEKGADV